jgi:hypothetical protein
MPATGGGVDNLSMTLLLSIVAFVALAVCVAGIYALLFDPKFIDEEEADFVQSEAKFREQMTTNLT